MSGIVRYALDSGGYRIPFQDMSAEVSEKVIELLKNGYILFRSMTGDYVLYSVDSDNVAYTLEYYESLVEKMCRKYQVPFYTINPVSIHKYFSNTLIQKLLDNILLVGNKSGILLGLSIKGDKTFYLVEVKGVSLCL